MSEMKEQRNSSIELLRIISMLIIVIYHYNARAFGLYVVGSDRIGEQDLLPELIMHSVGKIGVPIFVFISGWFGMKYRKERLGEMMAMCAFYAILSTVLIIPFYGLTRPNDALFFLNDWWFMAAYICVYLLSPGIDFMFQNTGKWTMLLIIGIFYYVSYGDYFMNEANIGGLYTMFTMYLSARWLKLYAYDNLNKYWHVLLAGSLLIRFGVIYLGYYTHHLGILPYINSYICPLTTIMAASIFFGVSKFSFNSKIVNILAGSSLAVYLFSEGTFGKRFFTDLFPTENFSFPHFVLGALLVYIIITAIDQVRGFITGRIVVNKLK